MALITRPGFSLESLVISAVARPAASSPVPLLASMARRATSTSSDRGRVPVSRAAAKASTDGGRETMFTAYRDPYIRPMADSPHTSVPIRQAATIVLADDGADGVEFLMVRRDHKAVFMSGSYVFPGGALDDIDDSPLARMAVSWSGDPDEFPWRASALRELFEEAGVLLGPRSELDQDLEGADLYEALVVTGERLDADALEYVGNWVTPRGGARRFDARFFMAAATADPVTDNREVFDAIWVRPIDALETADRGEMQLEFPTRKTLERFSGFATTAELMAAAVSVEVVRIGPRIGTAEDGSIVLLVPGDDGYDEAPE